MFRQVLNPANAINSFVKSLFPFFDLDCAQKHRSRLCLEEGKVLPKLVDTAIFFTVN